MKLFATTVTCIENARWGFKLRAHSPVLPTVGLASRRSSAWTGRMPVLLVPSLDGKGKGWGDFRVKFNAL